MGVVAVLLIIFLVQNTHSTEISFLWMTTRTPLAVALLFAAVGSVLLTLTVGTAPDRDQRGHPGFARPNSVAGRTALSRWQPIIHMQHIRGDSQENVRQNRTITFPKE